MQKNIMERQYRTGRMRNSLPEPQGDVFSHRWPSHEDGSWIPRLSMYWKEGKYFIDMELPGVEKRDISVHLCGKTLTITGRKDFRRELGDGPDYFVNEISFGGFHRIVSMPEEVNHDTARLALLNGMLSLVLEPRGVGATRSRIMNE